MRLELGFCNAHRLKVIDVEELIREDLLEALEGREVWLRERHTHVVDRGHTVRMQAGHLPERDGAPVVTDERRSFIPVMVEQCAKICGQSVRAVVSDLAGQAAKPVPAPVQRDRPIARRRQRLELVAPRVPGFGESVAQEDRRPVRIAATHDVHRDVIDLDQVVGEVDHRGSFTLATLVLEQLHREYASPGWRRRRVARSITVVHARPVGLRPI